MVRFEKVAGSTGEGEIIEVSAALAGLWNYVVYFERQVENVFRRSAILAAMLRADRYRIVG